MHEEKAVSKQIYSGIASLLRVGVIFLILVGLLLLSRIIVLFFGSLSVLPGYQELLKISDLFLGPVTNIKAIETPYKGVFDLAATIVLVIVLIAEFALSSVQHFFQRQAKQTAKAVAPNVTAPDTDKQDLTTAKKL